MILNSYAKLNLYLEVLNIRKDKFHNIKTIFERINLHDTIILKSRADKQIKIFSNSKEIPLDSSNLAFRSAKLLQDDLAVAKGVDIKIIKRIPVGSGMGGGSSNAATVLLGLNKLWKLDLSKEKLVNFAKKIGSDVPFFIYDCSFAYGRGRGDNILPLNLLSSTKLWHILVVPKIKVSTPAVYKGWDNKTQELTSLKGNDKIILSALMKKDPALISIALFNSLESVTSRMHPVLNIIREKLGLLGLKSVLMSGSGPAIFSVSLTKKEAVLAFKKLENKKFWNVFAVETF